MNLPRHQPYSLERNRQPSRHLGLTSSLVGTLEATVSFCLQGKFFGRNQNSSVPFNALPIGLPQKHDHMIYFAVSEYAFNTASRVYHQAGQMKFTIQNKHVSRGGRRLGSPERASDGTVIHCECSGEPGEECGIWSLPNRASNPGCASVSLFVHVCLLYPRDYMRDSL